MTREEVAQQAALIASGQAEYRPLPETGQQLERIATATDLDRVARLGLWLAAAESNSNDPKAKGMAAALRIGYAESLGLPAHAASEIHIIKGNLTLSAKMCRALAHKHGLRVIRKAATDDSCTAAVIDANGQELGEATYTLAQAKREGRTGDNWTKYPDRMMWARASKRALDDFAPWVTLGVVVSEDVLEGEIVPDPFEDGD